MLFEANFLGERANARPLHCFTCPYSNDQLSGAQLRYALVFHSSTKNRRWRAQTRYLGQLNGSFEPKPTAIVDSGNGIQCLWRLNQPIDLAQFPLAQDKHRKLILGPEALQIVDDPEARRPSLKERKLSRTLKPSRVAANCASVNWPTSWTRDTATERWQKLLVDFANDTKLQPSLRISAAQAAAPYQFPRKMSVAPPQYIHTQIVIPDFDSIEAAESFLAGAYRTCRRR